MATLKQIADEIAGALDRPFDDMFKERLKAIIKNERAYLIREQAEKYGLDDAFRQRYTVALERVDKADGLVDVNCDVLRTSNKIAKPIRLKRDAIFSYVGNAEGTNAYRFTELSELKFRHFLFLLADHISYNYMNGYVYIYGNIKLKTVTLDAAFESPELVLPNETAEDISNGIEYTEDMEFPLPIDMIQNIKARLLSGELSITDSKDKVPPSHIDND